MSNENLKVDYFLKGVNSEQFALIEANYNESDEVQIKVGLKVMRSDEEKLIGFFARLEFSQGESSFIIIETVCHFQIAPDSWKSILNEDTNDLTLPRNFASHLASISFGVCRGYLLGKVEKLPEFSKFFIPLIKVYELVPSDMLLKD